MVTRSGSAEHEGGRALGALLALLVVGCGSPGGTAPSASPEPAPVADPGPPAPTTAAVPDPQLDIDVAITPREDVEALSLDMVSLKVTIEAEDPADLAIPGPPALRLEVAPAEGGEPLTSRPHPMRPASPKGFPVSLEAGERLELGPMDLGTFDLDPLGVVAGKPYSVVARYHPGPEASEREVRKELVLAPPSADFPFENPLDQAEPVRPPVPLKIFAADGSLRTEYLWSPDTGLQLAEEPEPAIGLKDEAAPQR